MLFDPRRPRSTPSSLTRDESVRISQISRPPSSWTLVPSNSSCNLPALANSVLQRFNPTSAYPTPPTAGIRCSSLLAFALGYPSHVKIQQCVYQPEESSRFFKDFLNYSAQLWDSKPIQPASTPKPIQPPSTPQHSPSKVDSLPSKPPPAIPKPSVIPGKCESPDELQGVLLNPIFGQYQHPQ